MIPYCEICDQEGILVDNSEIYGKSYGNGLVYICPSFPLHDCYVGCHDNKEPLGPVMVGPETRYWRKRSKNRFNLLWKQKLLSQISPVTRSWSGTERSKAYRWLSIKLNKDRKDTHFGHFDIADCQLVCGLMDSYRIGLEDV